MITTLTVSRPDWVPLDHIHRHTLCSCLEQISLILSCTGPQDHGSLGETCLAHLGPYNRQTCSDYPVAVLKNWPGPCLPTPHFRAPDGDTSCMASTIYGTLRCHEGPADSKGFQRKRRRSSCFICPINSLPNLSPSPSESSPFLSYINRAGLG